MKKRFLTLVLIAVCLASGLVLAKRMWRGETMSAKQASLRWGSQDFNSDKFKSGDYSIRSSMAASMVRQQKLFIGKAPLEIRGELGDPDGFYFMDMFPAYMIDTKDNDSWQLVFLLNKNQKVSEVIIHKNCCDK